MKRLFLATGLALVAFVVPATAHARPCTRTYVIADFDRVAHGVYHGTHAATSAERRKLQRIIDCHRYPWEPKIERHIWRILQRDNHLRRHPVLFTGYVVSGTVSTFGPPAEGGSQTADGGSDKRPCIALRDTSTLGHMFRVTIVGHTADLLHCDSGPYAGGRSIDVTGNGAYKMGLNPFNFPTDSWGVARELR